MEYYKAYDERYKQMHKNGLNWEIMSPSPIVERVIEKYDVTKEATILEIGCGEGRDISYLLEKGYNVLGSDVSEEAIKYCKSKYEGKFKVIDVVKDEPNEYFDFIYSIAVIHMLVKDEDRKKYFRYIKEGLSDFGVGLICSMGDGEKTFETDITKAYDVVSREHSSGDVEVANTSCKMVTKATLEEEAINAGLKVLESGIVKDTPGFDNMIYLVVEKDKERKENIEKESEDKYKNVSVAQIIVIPLVVLMIIIAAIYMFFPDPPELGEKYNFEVVYAKAETVNIDISEYSNVREIDIKLNKKNTEGLDYDVFKNIDINEYVNGAEPEILDLYDVVMYYIEKNHESRLYNQFPEINTYELDDNTTLYLTEFDISVDESAQKVNYFEIEGYLLTK